MKPTIWIFSIEPLETRYTAEWHRHVPELLTSRIGSKFNVVQIDGVQNNTQATPGAFLNFSDTNYWKSSQLCAFLDAHNKGLTTPDDHILFTDAWNPTVIQLKYMSDLLGLRWKLHGLWHAGSYDEFDFLGRIVGDTPWVRNAEKSFYHAFDYNYFATTFHIEMFGRNLLGKTGYEPNFNVTNKVVRTGWPMEYMEATLEPYKGTTKRDLILFPHRIAPEKQVEIFRDLATALPQYEFVVCQDQKLTKKEYHTLLAQSKMVFSCSLQETLGISPYEGAILGAIPVVPDRLSYTEMYYEGFKYPQVWTENYASYLRHKQELCHHIMVTMTHYERRLPQLEKQTQDLRTYYFGANALVEIFK